MEILIILVRDRTFDIEQFNLNEEKNEKIKTWKNNASITFTCLHIGSRCKWET